MTYTCPHCGAVLEHVNATEPVPLVADDGRKRHAVTAARRAAVVSAYQRGGAELVRSELGVSKSQAYRLVAQSKATS